MREKASAALDFIFSDIDPGAPGGAAALIVGDAVVATRTAGLAHPRRKEAWSLRTRARIASLSKPMAAQVILHLASAGRVALDARAGDYLDWLAPPQADVTLRHMLCMRSGLLEEFPLVYLAHGAGAESAHSLDQRLALIAAQTRLNFARGARTLYSNTGYTLLQCIAEAVSGQSFAALLDKIVFAPAHMTRSDFLARDVWAEGDLGVGHALRDETLQPLEYLAEATAAGGVASTVEDLVKWAAALRRDPVWPQMTAPGFAAGDYASGYGLGVERKRLSGLETFGHAGGLRGWASDFIHVPSLDATVILLANRNDLNWYERAREALCLAFDLAPDPGATPRLIARDAPPQAWRAHYVDVANGHGLALSGANGEIAYEGRRVPRAPDGDFIRTVGVEPIRMAFDAIGEDAPASVRFTEGEAQAHYRRADPEGADSAAIAGVYEADALPGCIAIARVGEGAVVQVGAAWPQAAPLALKPLHRAVWRAFAHAGSADDAPLDLHLFWPDLTDAPHIMEVTMTRLLRYPYRRVGCSAQAERFMRWSRTPAQHFGSGS
ncbi:MAG: serine hydrolase domain-containing protein [Hyphomonadaceae bacterium]|nr:serine hydrolase domain-containing protein [Hyphomonadaceae bacterium]